jgi:hypothetical protein
MREISTDNYGPVTKDLLSRAGAALPKTLNFSTPVADAHAVLQSMNDQNVSNNRRVRMPQDAQALQAALWLLFDYMKESHDISQQIATPSGSYWHAILHRREPDPSNAKYWFDRVGEHPILPELLSDAKEIDASAQSLIAKLDSLTKWDAAWFVDRCGAADSATLPALLAIQRREWQLLFDYNFKKAFA